MNKLNRGNVSVGLVVLIGALAFAGGALVALLARPAPTVVSVGGATGTTHTNEEQFVSGLFISRETDLDNALPDLASSTNGTLTAAILCDNPIINVRLPGTVGQTITFPSSSAIFDRCLNALGVREVYIQNATGTGSFTLAVSDASTTLKLLNMTTSTATQLATSSLNGGDVAKVTLIRTATSTPTNSRWLHVLIQVLR